MPVQSDSPNSETKYGRIDSFEHNQSSTMAEETRLAACRYRLIVNPFTTFDGEVDLEYRTEDRQTRGMITSLWSERDQNIRYYVMLPVLVGVLLSIALIVMIFSIMSANRTSSVLPSPNQSSPVANEAAIALPPWRLKDVMTGEFDAPRLHGFWMSSKEGYVYINDAGDALMDDGRIPDLGIRNRFFPKTLDVHNSRQMTVSYNLLLVERPNNDDDDDDNDVTVYKRPTYFSMYATISWNNDRKMLFRIGRPINKMVHRVDYALFGAYAGQLAIVYEQNIYYYTSFNNNRRAQLITDTTSDQIYNGLTDSTHGFELWRNTPAMWFSPNGKFLAYLRFDDTDVPKSRQPPWRYVDRNILLDKETMCRTTGATKPTRVASSAPFRYSRNGERVPRVELFVVYLQTFDMNDGTHMASYRVPMPSIDATSTQIDDWAAPGAVGWASETMLVYVWMTRNYDMTAVRTCEIPVLEPIWSGLSKCTTMDKLQSQPGWMSVPKKPSDIGVIEGYTPKEANDHDEALVLPLELSLEVDNKQRLMQSFLNFIESTSTLTKHHPAKQLTDNVTRVIVERILDVRQEPNCMFYLGYPMDEPHKRHLYSVDVNFTTPIQCLTCAISNNQTDPNNHYDHFDVTISPYGNQVFVLHAEGPAVPYSAMYTWYSHSVWRSGCEILELRKLHTNHKLRKRIDERQANLRHVKYVSFPKLGYVRLLMPAAAATAAPGVRYPLLVQPYNGPDTFVGSSEWRLEWPDFMATNRSVIVAQVNGRGSSRLGLRWADDYVHRQTALEDSKDLWQIVENLVRMESRIDGKRIGIWGEGYAGYLAAMAMYSPAGPGRSPFRCGALVAPMPLEWNSLYEQFSPISGHPENSTVHVLNYREEENTCGTSNLLACIMDDEPLSETRVILIDDRSATEVTFQNELLDRIAETLDGTHAKYEVPNPQIGNVNCAHYEDLTRFFGKCFSDEFVS